MKENKFRGKRIDNKEWVYGSLFQLDGECFIVTSCIKPLGKDILFVYFEVDPETIGQTTTLDDKNGVTIFDGDIVKDNGGSVGRITFERHQWCVTIDQTECVLSKGLTFPLWQYDNCKENGYRKLEVIGNIYDNKELLETKGNREDTEDIEL